MSPVRCWCDVPTKKAKADEAALMEISSLRRKEVIILFSLCGHPVGPWVYCDIPFQELLINWNVFIGWKMGC